MENIDLECAKLGAQLGQYKDDEKLLTDSLGVLEEQGVYAFFLYLRARGKDAGKILSELFINFLHKRNLPPKQDGKEILCELTEMSVKLDDLLYARDLLRQSLIYARYHAKASSSERPKNATPPKAK